MGMHVGCAGRGSGESPHAFIPSSSSRALPAVARPAERCYGLWKSEPPTAVGGHLFGVDGAGST
jgi:hypothetical protein